MLKCVFENTLLNTLPVGAGQDKYQPFQSCRTPTGCLRKRWIQGDPGLEAWASLLQAYSLKTPSLIGSLFSPNMSKNAFKKLARGLCCHPGLDPGSYPILMLFRMRWRIKSAMTERLRAAFGGAAFRITVLRSPPLEHGFATDVDADFGGGFAGGGAGGQAEGDREAAGGKGAAEIGGDDGAADGGRPTHLRRGDMIAFGRGGDAFIQKEIHQKGVFLLSDGKRQPGDTGDDIADTQTTQRKSTQVVKRTDGLLQGVAVSISAEDCLHNVGSCSWIQRMG